MVKLIKQFFLCVFLFKNIVLWGMEFNAEIQDMHNFIDERYLGIDYDECGKCLISPCMSWFSSFFITQKQAAKEMQVIESNLLKKLDKQAILTILMEKHWYVGYLMQKLINTKLEEFENVKGSTIDALLSSTFEHTFEKIVWQKAYDLFLKNVSVNRICLSNVSQDILQYTVLPGHTCEVLYLAMSEDGNYLESIDYGNNKMLWDMRRGVKVEITRDAYDHIKWAQQEDNNYDSVDDEKGNYYATIKVKRMNINQTIYPHIEHEEGKVIYLFKRPTVVEYTCQKAFDNSTNISLKELTYLRKSDNIQLIKGFAKDNFEACFKDYLGDIK